MPLSKIHRREAMMAWIGIALAWAASSFAGVVLAAERTSVAVGATTAVALVAGVFVTVRLRHKEPRARIKVSDLRPDRNRRS